MTTHTVAVVHLVWKPFGTELFRNFLQSYKTYPSGYPHDLIIIFNGATGEDDTSDFHLLARQEKISYIAHYLPGGLDIMAYRTVASALHHEYVFFLNSYAVLLSAGWLHHFMIAILKEKVGMVGATGSWQSYYSTVFSKNRLAWEKDQSFNHNFRKYKLLLKSFFYWQMLFKAFPNPHIRTSSFIMNRKLFLSAQRKDIHNKFDAYLFESGKKGLSNTLLKMGYTLLVMDKEGRTYEPEVWPLSLTFHIENQQGLMVSDNRTREYEESGDKEKKMFTFLAWGKYGKI